MKKTLFLFILMIASLSAKPCMTDIYFGNGVWNTQQQAIEGRNTLKRFMQYQAITQLDPQKEGETYTFKHAYNPSTGTQTDLIETFWQLRESGQIDEGYFQMIASTLAAQNGATTHEEVLAQIHNVIAYYNYNTSTMYDIYQSESFNQRHNVLLVAHSQGNLFGNKMYTLMSDAQKQKFRMVSVATPADHVAGYTNGGPYVTATGDYVIRPIPGSLPANIAGFGHTFIGTYLNVPGGGVLGDGSDNAPTLIALHVKNAYDNLIQTTSCQTYWAINMKLHTDGYMTVFAYPIIGGREVYASEEIGTVDFHPYAFTEERDKDGKVIKRCDVEPSDVKRWGDIDLCRGGLDEICGWMAGEIYNKSTLEARKNLKFIMTSQGSTQCIPIAHDGELYELTKDLFE